VNAPSRRTPHGLPNSSAAGAVNSLLSNSRRRIFERDWCDCKAAEATE
jgi:hypothetical protein